jgi:hypothetical protein
MTYLTSDLLNALISDQAILRKEIIAERNSLFTNLLKDFLFITASDQANVSESLQFCETLNHRLLNELNKRVSTFLGLVRVPSMSKRQILLLAILFNAQNLKQMN